MNPIKLKHHSRLVLLGATLAALLVPACMHVHVDPVEVKPLTLDVNVKYVDEKLDKAYGDQPNLQGPSMSATRTATTGNSNAVETGSSAAKLRAAKSAGKIGETSVGLIEAVDVKSLNDPDLKSLIQSENSDRAALYEIIANETHTTTDLVGQRAGVRNFTKALAGDYLKGTDGNWTQKK